MSKKTMSTLFIEFWSRHAFFALGDCGLFTATIVALFLDHNHKSNFRHPL
jgi:hypothetical protein